ncbi:MAG: AAA family ATPase, partial [Proteobacteria bacterium]|nr:AAA family ATPase [Pseudomonadota bacterium]
MSILPGFTPCTSLRDEYADLVDLYLMRIVCGAQRGSNPFFRLPVESTFSQVFSRSSTDHYKEAELVALMALRLAEVEVCPPKREGPLFDNIKFLASRLGLSSLQQELLIFRVLVRNSEELENVVQSFGMLSESRLARILALALNQYPHNIEEALEASGALIGSALVRVEHTMEQFLEKLSLITGLPNALLQRHSSLESLISFAVRRADAPGLSRDDYPHMVGDLDLMCRYLQAAMANRMPGVNILLYGPPGVGKSQLARVVAKQIGLALYEVACSASDGDGLIPIERYANYQLNQQFFSKERNTIILFDEAEEMLLGLPVATRHHGIQQRHGKAWVNQILEQNPIPSFWIANSVE